jgi:hypothetical protein
VRTQADARRRLLREWRTVLDRIDIMTALVEWQPAPGLGEAPGLGLGLGQLQPQLQPAQAAAPPAAQRSPAAAAGHQGAAPSCSAVAGFPDVPAGPPRWRPQQQQQAPQCPQPEQLHPYMQRAASWEPDAEPSAPAWPA